MTDPPRLILVTGTPRSGTTPVGDALAAAPRTRALYEPLNFHVGDRRIQRYFEVPDAGGFSGDLADELVRDINRLRLRLRPGLFPEDRGVRRLIKRVTGSRTRMTYRLCRLDRRLRTIVWKDPFAVFIAARVARAGVPVVVTARPPTAVAASFKRLGWRFDVADLMTRLGPVGDGYAGLLEGVDLESPAHNAAVLWHVSYDVLLAARRDADGIHMLDLDRFVADRAGVLRALYQRLGLPWSTGTEQHLRRTAAGDGPARPTGTRAHGGRRDPAAVNRYWVDVLTRDEAAVSERLNADLWERVRAAAL